MKLIDLISQLQSLVKNHGLDDDIEVVLEVAGDFIEVGSSAYEPGENVILIVEEIIVD